MIIDGWLPCTRIKKGYFKLPDLLNWWKTGLFPTLRRESSRPRVIVLNNCFTHVDGVVVSTIEAEKHVVSFLSPYSPDFNPIELCFSVLKAWLQRNYVWTRHRFENFGRFLSWAIVASRCDRYAREQFKHAAGGLYLEEGELGRFRRWLRDWESGTEDIDGEETRVVRRNGGIDSREKEFRAALEAAVIEVKSNEKDRQDGSIEKDLER